MKYNRKLLTETLKTIQGNHMHITKQLVPYAIYHELFYEEDTSIPDIIIWFNNGSNYVFDNGYEHVYEIRGQEFVEFEEFLLHIKTTFLYFK